MNKINVGVFPCEAENAYELYRSLQYATRFHVVGLASKVDHCQFEFPHIYDGLPYMAEKISCPSLLKLFKLKIFNMFFRPMILLQCI